MTDAPNTLKLELKLPDILDSEDVKEWLTVTLATYAEQSGRDDLAALLGKANIMGVEDYTTYVHAGEITRLNITFTLDDVG